MRRWMRAAMVVSTTAVVAGCGSSISGIPTRGAAPVDVSNLKIGSYSPQPTRYDTTDIGEPRQVRELEARRMLNFVVPSIDVDPEIDELLAVETYTDASGPFSTPAMPEHFRPALSDNNLLAGVYVVRTNGKLRGTKKINIAVLRFPTDAMARNAFDQMGRITKEQEQPVRELPIEGRSEAFVSTEDGSSGRAIMTRGPFMIMISAAVPQPDESALSASLKKAIDLQITEIDRLQPTPWEDVLDTPVDPDGIMRRALPLSSDGNELLTDVDFYAHQRTGQLHYERNPAVMKAAFLDNGVDLIGRRAGIVYRARDLDSAFRLQTALMTLREGDEELSAPPGLVDARCIRLYTADPERKQNQLCAVVRGRYVGVVGDKPGLAGGISPALYERAAAQYAVLANCEREG